MKKFAYLAFAFVLGVFTSCTDKEEIEITRHHTLNYVVNTQSMYDNLGITSEISSNFLNKGYSIGIYSFVYDSNGNKVSSKSSTCSEMGSYTEEFVFEEGSYTIVTFEALVGNGSTPSWNGEDKLATLVFEDKNTSDYHYISGKVQTEVTLNGGNQTVSVTPEATRVLLTLNINLQSMYDEFGITDKLTDYYLRDNNAPVGVFTYIYNSQGDLVDSVTTQQYSLNNATQIRSLAKGDYTILSIETLVDPSNNLPVYWRFDDTKKLTTVKMSQLDSDPSMYEVVGVATATVNLTGNKELSITNKAIGSIVHFLAFNFENTSYGNISFGTTDILDYYSFNPQLSRKDKFKKKLLSSDYFTSRGLILTPEESANIYKSAYFLECKINWSFMIQFDIEVNSWNGLDEGNASLEDGKIYYAGFYYLGGEKGVFDTYFGNLEDLYSWMTECDQRAQKLNTTKLFEQPYITWGGTVSAVKSFMSGYELYGDDTTEEGEYILVYNGKYKESQIYYLFTSKTGGLTDAFVFFDSQEIGEDVLLKAFKEMEYTFLYSEDGYSLYCTKDYTSFVKVGLNNNMWYVWYFNVTSNTASSRAMDKNIPAFIPKRQSVKNSMHSGTTEVLSKLRQCEKMMRSYSK